MSDFDRYSLTIARWLTHVQDAGTTAQNYTTRGDVTHRIPQVRRLGLDRRVHRAEFHAWAKALSDRRTSWQTDVRGRIFVHIKERRLVPVYGLVLLRLIDYANYDDGQNAHPGLAVLGEDLRLGERRLRRAIERGRQLRIIEQTGRGGGWGPYKTASTFRFLSWVLDTGRPKFQVDRLADISPGSLGPTADTATALPIYKALGREPGATEEEPDEEEPDADAVASGSFGDQARTAAQLRVASRRRGREVDYGAGYAKRWRTPPISKADQARWDAWPEERPQAQTEWAKSEDEGRGSELTPDSE